MRALWQVFFTVDTPDAVAAETLERTVSALLERLPEGWQVEGVAAMRLGTGSGEQS